jgi:hypothetical protein
MRARIAEVGTLREASMEQKQMSNTGCKTCVRCGAGKLSSEFYSAGKTRLHSYCKDCMRHAAKMAARKMRTDPEKRERLDRVARELKWLKTYGLMPEDYESLLELQGGRCGICGTTETGREGQKYFDIDHCHSTGKVRGLLCSRCNRGIGLLGDNPETLREAARYLERANVQRDEPIC